MMFNKDCDLIFEAYQSDIVEEMPVGFGAAHEEPEEDVAGKFEAGALAKLTDQYLSASGKKLPPEAKKKILIDQIIAVKQFLKKAETETEEGMSGPHTGSLKAFYMSLLKTMVEVGGKDERGDWYVNLANAKYRARVIVNQMNSLDVLDVTKKGKVVVKDVDEKEPAIDAAVADAIEGEHEPSGGVAPVPAEDTPSVKSNKVMPHKQYMLNPDKVAGDRINTLDDSVKAAIGAIRGKLAIKFTGKEVINVLRATVGLSAAQELGAHMIEIGVLEAEEEEHEGDVTDVAGDYSHEENPAWAAHDMTGGGTDTVATGGLGGDY